MSDGGGTAAAHSRATIPLLVAQGLQRREAGRTVLGPVDLEVTAGDALAIVGPNGAGKTTLLRLLAGILPPTAGAVRLAGRDLATTPRRDVARQMVYLPQHPPAEVPLSVDRYLLLARFAHRRASQGPGDADARSVADALAATELGTLRERSVADLSGGERQLVQLAGALVQGGDTWLVDEPTAHLDPAHQRRVARLLGELHAGAGAVRANGELAAPDSATVRGPRTLLLATHDLNLAARLATRVVALVGGSVAAAGPPEEVLAPDRLEALYGAPFRAVGAGPERRLWLEL